MTTMMNCRFEGFEAISGGRKTKQDKGPASPAAVPSDFCPQCGQFWGRRAGVKTEKKNSSGVPDPCRAQKHSTFSGVRTPERSKDE